MIRTGSEPEVALAVAATDWVFDDYATGAPRRIPPEITGSFEIAPDLE